ncbi:Uncharacterised protein [Mycobacterium tuberculosis]|nr:Uncharacterised protein [Mycobacterium tuberculosis]
MPGRFNPATRDSADEIVHGQLAKNFVVERTYRGCRLNTEFLCERGLESMICVDCRGLVFVHVVAEH